MTTAGRYKNIDLTYLLFDNESNKSTGGQNTYQGHVDYINIAKSSNLSTLENVITNLKEFSTAFEEIQKTSGLKFIHVKCGIDNETPRPPIDIVKVNKF
jgi:phosphonopyruvate decarboxylase